MPYLHISLTLPNQTYHGVGDDGKPEWPPSPMRLFQALVATAARRDDGLSESMTDALNTFSALPPPTIFAPRAAFGIPWTTSVPNNAMDIVAGAWSRGNETGKDAQPATHRAMKTVRTTYFEESVPITYLWKLDVNVSGDFRGRMNQIVDLAKQVFAVGWGLDLAAVHAEFLDGDLAPKFSGERWIAVRAERGGLRVPNEATLKELERRHRGFLNRVSGQRLNSIPSISPAAYRQIAYRCDTNPDRPAVAVFQFLKVLEDRFQAFPTLRACTVAGMLRHATANAAEQSGWTRERVGSFVLGHGERRNETHAPVGRERFAYLPLPSLEFRGGETRVVGPIRRSLLYVPAGTSQESLFWANQALDGCELNAEGKPNPQAIVSRITAKDRNVQSYLRPAALWESVTPVVLPGRDDRKQKKAERLLRKAIVQAGFSETLAEHAEIDWRSACFWPGGEIANRYFLPHHLRNFPRCHCQIRWKDPQGADLEIPGPIAIGGGKYAGLGLFASPHG